MSETTNTTDFLDIYRKAALFISPNIFQEIKTNYTDPRMFGLRASRRKAHS